MTTRRLNDIVSRYVVDARLKCVPSKRVNKLAIFYWLSEQFEIDAKYPERDVNDILSKIHPDFATLRRGLYDEYFFNRNDGVYWRTPDRQKLVLVE